MLPSLLDGWLGRWMDGLLCGSLGGGGVMSNHSNLYNLLNNEKNLILIF